MVRGFNSVVYLAAIRLPVGRTHDVIYPHIKAIAMIADTWPVTALHVAVGEFFGQPMPCKRNRTVVKIAAENHASIPVFTHKLRHGFHLRSSYLSIFAQLVHQLFRFVLHLSRLHFAFHHGFEVLPLLLGESSCSEMIIDNNHRIAAQIQQIGHTKIV